MPSILVVDDEDQIRQLLRETFEQAGYHVTEARDGKEALQQYRLAPADLVIMDILMPDQDGLETTATLRREFPNVDFCEVFDSCNHSKFRCVYINVVLWG